MKAKILSLALGASVAATPSFAQSIYTPYAFTNFAGLPSGGPGTADGIGSAARFGRVDYFVPDGPVGVAADGAGNAYVADGPNNTVRKITVAGVVTTFAGKAGEYGSDDGLGSAARFVEPLHTAVDGAGNIYVADGNETIRKITPAGMVTTLAGCGTCIQGYVDGTGSEARFEFWPYGGGLAVDSSGNVFVADTWNAAIRKITPEGVVTTLAGGSGLGYTNGFGTNAAFNKPISVALDHAGNIYVADSGNDVVRKITPEGMVTTLAGTPYNLLSPGICQSADGMGPNARFCLPMGIAVDAATNVYVTDAHNFTLRKISPEGMVTTLAGEPGQFGNADGLGQAARFGGYYDFTGFWPGPYGGPIGAAVDSAGHLYVADNSNNTIRKVSPEGMVTTLAGRGAFGSTDGLREDAQFHTPSALAVDSNGTLYVADTDNHTIRKITPDGNVTTLAGSAYSDWFCRPSTDGIGNAASFCYPSGVAVDRAGNLYVTDSGRQEIRKISLSGAVSTLVRGQMGQPEGVAVDREGYVYVADNYNHTILKVSPGGVVSTLAGAPGEPGANDGVGTAARFNRPGGIAVDGEGFLYLADTWNNTVRKISPGGEVSTLAGKAGEPGDADGVGTEARFGGCTTGSACVGPTGVAVDSTGNVYVTDARNHTVRRITPGGTVTTLAGRTGQVGWDDGIGSKALFGDIAGLAVDGMGNVYVADASNNRITKGVPVLQFDQSVGTLAVVNGVFHLRLKGSSVGNVVLEASGDFRSWTPFQTNALPPQGLEVPVSLGANRLQFFRARLAL